MASIQGRDDEPIAYSSALGWLLTGEVPECNPCRISHLSALHIVQDNSLDDLLQRFWLQEEVPSAPLYNQEEQDCEDHFLATYSRNKEGRFVPFKNPEKLKGIDFKQSYYPAKRMLLKLENRFLTDPRLREIYRKFLSEYEALGHMTNIPLDEVDLSPNGFYTPHHGVWKEKSTTTKLRTVFNGSFKLKSGRSMNELLLTGPNLLTKLADMLINPLTPNRQFLGRFTILK